MQRRRSGSRCRPNKRYGKSHEMRGKAIHSLSLHLCPHLNRCEVSEVASYWPSLSLYPPHHRRCHPQLETYRTMHRIIEAIWDWLYDTQVNGRTDGYDVSRRDGMNICKAQHKCSNSCKYNTLCERCNNSPKKKNSLSSHHRLQRWIYIVASLHVPMIWWWVMEATIRQIPLYSAKSQRDSRQPFIQRTMFLVHVHVSTTRGQAMHQSTCVSNYNASHMQRQQQ